MYYQLSKLNITSLYMIVFFCCFRVSNSNHINIYLKMCVFFLTMEEINRCITNISNTWKTKDYLNIWSYPKHFELKVLKELFVKVLKLLCCCRMLERKSQMCLIKEPQMFNKLYMTPGNSLAQFDFLYYIFYHYDPVLMTISASN